MTDRSLSVVDEKITNRLICLTATAAYLLEERKRFTNEINKVFS